MYCGEKVVTFTLQLIKLIKQKETLPVQWYSRFGSDKGITEEAEDA